MQKSEPCVLKKLPRQFIKILNKNLRIFAFKQQNAFVLSDAKQPSASWDLNKMQEVRTADCLCNGTLVTMLSQTDAPITTDDRQSHSGSSLEPES